MLGGFSQGGALALYSGLTGPVHLAGILGLSTWVPIPQEIDWDKIQQKSSVLLCHGDQDEMITLETATKNATLLKKHLSSFTFKTYTGLDHSISSSEMEDITEFLKKVLPPNP